MSFHHPAHYKYQEFIIRHSGAICAAATLICQIFPKLWEDICSPVKDYWSIAQSRVLLCEKCLHEDSFSPEICIFWGWYRCLENVKNLWNVVRSKKKRHSDTEHWFLCFIISLCCTVTPIYASVNTNAPLLSVTVFCYCEGKCLYFL